MMRLDFRPFAGPTLRRQTLGLVLFGLIGCEDVPGGTVLGGATPLPILTQTQPATPGPRIIATPRIENTPLVATPAPATPSPSTSPPPPSPSPTPVAGTPSASPSPDPGASPDRYKKTNLPLDLAISGPGYFVLSTKPNPMAVEDLLFTRTGHFKLQGDTAGSLSLFRLRHADTDFHAVGFMIPGGTAAGAPEETTSEDGAQLATMWGPLATTALGVFLDADRNTDAAAKASFDYTGRVKVADTSPRGPDGSPVQLYVAVAQFATPTALVSQPGFKGIFKYDPAAGAVQLGVAVSGPGRVVGNANLILTSTLEIQP